MCVMIICTVIFSSTFSHDISLTNEATAGGELEDTKHICFPLIVFNYVYVMAREISDKRSNSSFYSSLRLVCLLAFFITGLKCIVFIHCLAFLFILSSPLVCLMLSDHHGLIILTMTSFFWTPNSVMERKPPSIRFHTNIREAEETDTAGRESTGLRWWCKSWKIRYFVHCWLVSGLLHIVYPLVAWVQLSPNKL